jgi:hypothetical protein
VTHAAVHVRFGIGLPAAAIGLATCGTLQAQFPSFTDATADAGIDAFQDPPPFTPYAPMVGGGAVGDFNNDGYQDLFILMVGGAADKLYINDGDGTFTDRAADWGVAQTHLGYGVAVGDYDGNGFVDLYVTSLGTPGAPAPGMHRLYRNNGDDTFTDVAVQAGVDTTCTCPDFPDAWGACFGDYDLDGDLDLAVGSWRQPSGGNRLFRNEGNGTFTDVTDTAVLYDMTSSKTWSPYFVDMDGDRFPEILWVGDGETSLYLVNNGNGTFSDLTGPAGVGLDQFGMGNTVGDFDGDGLLDWYVSSIYRANDPTHLGNMLYMNGGGHSFTETSVSAGVEDGGWGWGPVAVDVNHDRLLDIVETNGYPPLEFTGEPSRVFLNLGNDTFLDVAPASGFDHFGQGRGLSRIDYDNDGDQDFVVFGFEEQVTLFRNDLSAPDTNWLRVFLDTRTEPRLAPNGYGTRVFAEADGQSQVCVVDTGCSFLSPSEPSAHFGLGAASSVNLRVEWINGRVEQYFNVPVNQTITIVPGRSPRLTQQTGLQPPFATHHP